MVVFLENMFAYMNKQRSDLTLPVCVCIGMYVSLPSAGFVTALGKAVKKALEILSVQSLEVRFVSENRKHFVVTFFRSAVHFKAAC